MSFLKKIDIKNNTLLVKEFFFQNVWTNISLYLIGASLVFSLILVQFSLPQFNVSATLREAQTETSSNNSNLGVGTNLIQFTNSKSNVFNEFVSNMQSYVIAQRMWDKGWATEIYAGGDETIDFNKIKRTHTIGDRLSALLLGYELYDYYSPNDLQDFIKANVSVSKEIKGTNITVSMLSDDQKFALKFLNEIIIDTDKYAKEYLILKSNAIIDETYKQLAISKNSAISASLAATINSEYLKIATLQNDLPYHIYFIDPPHSSEYPVTPKVSAIFISNIIIFIFISTLYSFVKSNKEDLW